MSKAFSGQLFYDHSLSRYTSWRLGGKADRFYKPGDTADLQYFLETLPPDEPLTWLGLGSNVLIREGGIRGTVILTLNQLKQISKTEGLFRIEAGVPCAKVAKLCIQEHCAQGAFFAGIPGTMGGALRMNAGAFGQETWHHVEAVETIDRFGKIYFRARSEFTVGYRELTGLNDQFFIAGHFKFASDDSQSVKKMVAQLLRQRNDTQPIGAYSCGSVFKNPPGHSAGQLIETAGLKGTVLGGAEVSPKHANFIVNRGASAKDVENLIEYVQERVYQIHRIQLTKEVHIIGEH